MTYAGPWRGRLDVVAGLSIGLTVAADWLFFGERIGWTLGAFLLVLVGALWLRRLGGPTRAALLLTLALTGIAIAMIDEPGPIEMIFALVGLGLLAMTLRGNWTGSAGRWAWRFTRLGTIGWLKIFRDSRRVQRYAEHRRLRMLVTLNGLLLWIIPVGLSLVFVAIFAVANPIIERWVGEIGTWLSQLHEYLNIPRAVFYLVMIPLVWALLRIRVRRGSATPSIVTSDPLLPNVIPAGLVVRCLLLFNVIFAVETVLDLVYLWGGAALPAGMTYAQYAHRGAYPLIGAALLAGLFVLACFRPNAAADRSRAARVLVYLWLMQSVILVGSSVWRLGLYIDVYQLSRWRVAAALWMALVATGLVLVIVRIATRRSNSWLINANAAAAMIVCYAIMFVPVDRIIADFNVRHCREVTGEGVPLDVAYLKHLGNDAIPALRWVSTQLPATETAKQADRVAARLETDLRQQVAEWRGWTWRRGRLLDEVEAGPIVLAARSHLAPRDAQ